MKKICGYLFLLLALLGVFLSMRKEKSVYLKGALLPILTQFEGKDFRGEKSFGFTTLIGGEEKAFEIYPAVFIELLFQDVALINLAEMDDQFVREEKRGYFEYVGKTKEDIHLFYIHDHFQYASYLLFVEIEKNQGAQLRSLLKDETYTFYEDQVLIRKVGSIPLGTEYYFLKDFELKDNSLKVGWREFTLDLKPSAPPELMLRNFPFQFDQRPFVSPFLVDSYCSSMRTGDTSIVAYDIVQAQNNPMRSFFGNGFTNKDDGNYEYTYRGMTNNGVHIVHFCYYGAHPTIGRDLLFVYEKDYELRVDWDQQTITRDKERILLKKIGELDLYYSKPFLIEGNTISYSDTYWENKPGPILGEVEEEEFLQEVSLNP